MYTAKMFFSIVLCLIVTICLFNFDFFALEIDSSEAEMSINIDTTVDGNIITDTFSIDSKYFFDNENTPFGSVYNLIPYTLSSVSYDKDSGYGGQLTAEQKKIYDELVSSYVSFDGVSCSENTAELILTPLDYIVSSYDEVRQDITYAYFAFAFDYPQVFWASGYSADVSWYEYADYCEIISIVITLNETYLGAKSEIQQYNSGLASDVSEIMSSVKDESSYGYYVAIHDWMCHNLSYNYDSLYNPEKHPKAHSSSGVFVGNGSVVCQGYGEAFKVLCDYIRIKYDIDLFSSLIIGYADSGEAHMWNYVYLSDVKNWYALDVCWDDQESGMVDTYFLVGSDSLGFNTTFSQEHIENNNFSSEQVITFTYPIINSVSYEKNDNISIEGIITSYGSKNDTIIITLFDKIGSVVDSIEITDSSYSLSVPAGEYILEVSKKDHVPRKYPITVDNTTTLPDIEIHLIGDIDGSGYVNIDDVNKANMHYKNSNVLSGYDFLCADVTEDGKVDILDVNKLNLHFNNKIKLW